MGPWFTKQKSGYVEEDLELAIETMNSLTVNCANKSSEK